MRERERAFEHVCACVRARMRVYVMALQIKMPRPKKNPLFVVDLVMEADKVEFSTPLVNFETCLINLFDNAIAATHSVPQLEKVNLSFTSRTISVHLAA